MYYNPPKNPKESYGQANLLHFSISFISLLFLITITSCTRPPTASDIHFSPNPNKNVPLAAILSFKVDRPVNLSFIIDDGQSQQSYIPDDEYRSEHNTPILGLKPDRQHKVIASIKDNGGREIILDTFEIKTEPLPDDFPPLDLVMNQSGDMEPGVTMINFFRWKGQFEDDPDWGLIAAVDHAGEVVWYMRTDYGIGEARRMFNGNLMFGGKQDGRQFEVDMLGNIINEWHTSGVVLDSLPEGSIPVATDNFHHDVIELPSGNFIGLGLEVTHFPDFPAEYPPSTKKAPGNVAGDIIIEYDRAGNTVRKWDVLEILDPRRLGEGSLRTDFYGTLYKDRYDPLPMDITHSNAIYYVEEEDAVIVSSNIQCAVYKVDMSSGELLWILSDPIQWKEPWSDKLLKPKGELIWPCHQHGLELTPDGNLLMFDNGGSRSVPPQEPMPAEDRFSRAIEFKIDEVAGTVEEVWSYGPKNERFVSPFISDADYLPETGNILVTDGGRFKGPNGEAMNTFGGHQWARVFEVTHDKESKKIWEIQIYDPEIRYSVYRAQRFLSLYPKLDRPTG